MQVKSVVKFREGLGYGKDTVESLSDLYDLYNKLFFKNELPKIPVKWNNRLTRVIGRCKYKKNDFGEYEATVIELSKKHHSINDGRVLSNTLLHEMIHVIHHNHKRGFREMARYINKKTGLHIGRVGLEPNEKQYNRYVIRCKKCGMTTGRNRDMTKGYRCGQCKGGLEIIEDRGR